MLAYLVRSSDLLAGVDESAAEWGFDHASDLSDADSGVVTTLGETWFVIVAAIVLTVVDHIRMPTRWVAGYLAVVILGQNFLTRTIKELADRVRPDLNPIAETLGPSFPSGHSATAAAFWAAAALVLGRGLRRPHHALLAGGAVGIAVAVAGSRVLLDVHWLSDVVAGVCLGWAWFAVFSVAFGGRVLRFGKAVERAEEVAVADERGAARALARHQGSSRPSAWKKRPLRAASSSSIRSIRPAAAADGCTLPPPLVMSVRTNPGCKATT